MKKMRIAYFCFITVALLNACSKSSDNRDSEIVQSSYEGYSLVWSDEFDGNEINLDNWEHEVNANGGGNNELQYYTDRKENSLVENGNLVIVALRENYSAQFGTRSYTSARLRTANKADFLYGRFEIRAKMPKGQGLWPAIWMLPTDWEYGGWPRSGEIDIMEIVGHQPFIVHGTIHYYNNSHQYSGNSYRLSEGDFSDDFHTFRVDWEPNEIRWYVDDNLYSTKNTWASTPNAYPAPFDKRFHFLINIAVGGNWPGNPIPGTVFPQFMYVDWVRVYQKD